jgi:phenylalanyl-tRNA synthetase beta chain
MTGDYFLGVNNKRPVNFFVMKGIAEEVLDFLGYGNRYSFVMPKKEIPEFHPGQVAEINVNGKIVGILGKLHPSIEKNDVYVMEINLDTLLDIKTGKMKFREISIYPTIKQDIALVVDKNVSADDIMKTIKKAAGNLLVKQEMFDMYQNAALGDKKSVAFSLTFGSNDKTLTDDEINPVMEKIIKALESNLKAELRK